MEEERQELGPAPKDFIERAGTLFCNGIFGYQAPGCGISNNKLAICLCSDNLTEQQIQTIKSVSGANILIHDDYLGNGYLTIGWTEYNKIGLVFDAILGIGQWFKTNNKAAAIFRPETDKVFSEEIMERKCIENINELMRLMPNCLYDSYYIKDVYLDIWNWSTDQGRNFCKYLRDLKRLPEPDLNHADNYYKWPIFMNYDPKTLLSVNDEAPQQKKIKEDKIDEDKGKEEEKEEVEEVQECFICMDKVANTMVLPCSHCIVCSDCSIRLRNTNDHHTCVKCRRPITDILE
ncbi:MAG: RING finger domain protein [Barrevirus sp.]|uniref:RING finger domain protein n=1 Tax=Barrevirus sp. TaxID=2487763 RepID=A0A3G4ZQZ0_9VIRU|nr:MAG: RING finger domain protein [Barrevirus sp.]